MQNLWPGTLGGTKENPGVWGHGGGVIIKSVCAHCGKYRINDTWAQNPENGVQGLNSVTYEGADFASIEWLAQRLPGAEARFNPSLRWGKL